MDQDGNPVFGGMELWNPWISGGITVTTKCRLGIVGSDGPRGAVGPVGLGGRRFALDQAIKGEQHNGAQQRHDEASTLTFLV